MSGLGVVVARSQFVVTLETVTMGGVWFVQEDEDDREVSTHDVCLPRGLWEGLGSPEVLTVTVEPGDLLNVGGSA